MYNPLDESKRFRIERMPDGWLNMDADRWGQRGNVLFFWREDQLLYTVMATEVEYVHRRF